MNMTSEISYYASPYPSKRIVLLHYFLQSQKKLVSRKEQHTEV